MGGEGTEEEDERVRRWTSRRDGWGEEEGRTLLSVPSALSPQELRSNFTMQNFINAFPFWCVCVALR